MWEARDVLSVTLATLGGAMNKWFVSRHPGAIEWAHASDLGFDYMVEHMSDLMSLAPGDCVYGNLPVNVAAEICRRGGRYFHLTLDVSKELRGKELSATDLNTLGAHFQEFVITAPDHG